MQVGEEEEEEGLPVNPVKRVIGFTVVIREEPSLCPLERTVKNYGHRYMWSMWGGDSLTGSHLWDSGLRCVRAGGGWYGYSAGVWTSNGSCTGQGRDFCCRRRCWCACSRKCGIAYGLRTSASEFHESRGFQEGVRSCHVSIISAMYVEGGVWYLVGAGHEVRQHSDLLRWALLNVDWCSINPVATPVEFVSELQILHS